MDDISLAPARSGAPDKRFVTDSRSASLDLPQRNVSAQGTGTSGHAPKVRFSEDLGRPVNSNNMDHDSNPTENSSNIGNLILPNRGVAGSNALMGMPGRKTSQARNRGYSLRRAVFAQNLKQQQEDGSTVFELENPTSSHAAARAGTPDKTEKASTVVNIEELTESRSDLGDSVDIRDKSSIPDILPDSLPICNRPTLVSRITNFCNRASAAKERLFAPVLLPPTADGRHVTINAYGTNQLIDERSDRPYISNKIRSCKYTPWNFVPKQLWAQFGKLANFYFLIVSTLQMVPGLSTTGTYTTIIPLLVFISISMAKEGYEDIRRARLDKEENERTALVLDAGSLDVSAKSPILLDPYQASSACWKPKKWQDVKVGDVLLIERNAPVPADVILLRASGQEGIAYIETKSLDGETNLKSKKAADAVAERCHTEQELARLHADFVVEDPNLDLYKFEGRVSLIGQTVPLTSEDVIYRGSILRNTATAVGLVIYSGEECKIRMNANKNPRVKAPNLQFKVNRVVAIVAGLVLLIALTESVGYLIWHKTTEKHSFYLQSAQVPFGHILTSFVIMFNTMLPLSLYVSLEIVKVAQTFMMNDIDMYDPETDIPMEARTSTINEELGQVSYIFTDKTGTLTNNSMKFRKLSVAGTAWLHDIDLQNEAIGAQAKLRHKKRRVKGKQKSGSHRKHKKNDASVSYSPLVAEDDLSPRDRPTEEDALETQIAAYQRTGKTEELLEYIQRRPQTVFAKKARFFILALALCHTCMPEKDNEGEIHFQAASPDELALVTAAQELGYIVTDRQNHTLTIKTYPQGDESEPVFEIYHLLEVVEFSSARKRMSIIVRFPDGRLCLFCKGADTTVRKLLRLKDLAAMNVQEIKKRNEIRKSMEVQTMIRKQSMQIERSASISQRVPSIGGGRMSEGLARRSSVRQSIDVWLKEKENIGGLPRKSDIHYAPRLSEALADDPLSPLRPSGLSADSPRNSFQTDDMDDLVDEAIAVNENAIFQRCFNHIDDFASEGLRTLVYGHRFLQDDEYMIWKDMYNQAATSLSERQMRMERAAEQIEQQLELTGATAIEDKLQKGVPEAIERFRRAGIKMWMLTGDKRETAINIGHSCHLIKEYSTVLVLDHEKGDLPLRMTQATGEVKAKQNVHSVLVVDGQTLTFIECDARLQEMFIELAVAADSVICCRASPSQKAALVKIIRLQVKGSVTLAIGDGANDIAMIQEAHVGIGIAGKEGLQAARTSDYSIAQFRFLVKLLLVHGRWNYVRVCKYTLGTFWKEMLFYLVQAVFQRWTGYTGTSLYEPWSMSMFNTLFTSLPVIFIGVFEKDLAASTLIAVPELYTFGHQNRGFNLLVYARWALMGTIEAMIVYFTTYSLFGAALFTKDDHLFAIGCLAFSACVTVISLKLQVFELHNKSVTATIAILLSVGGWWAWNLLLSTIYDPHNVVYNVRHGLTKRFGRNGLWWLTLFLIVISISLLEITVKAVKTTFLPNDAETFQVFERDIEVRKRFEESAADLLQEGWNRQTKKKSSLELIRDMEEQAKREAEVEEILNRPRTMDYSSKNHSKQPLVTLRKRLSWQPTDDEIQSVQDSRQPLEFAAQALRSPGELFKEGYGMVKKESMK